MEGMGFSQAKDAGKQRKNPSRPKRKNARGEEASLALLALPYSFSKPGSYPPH